MGLIDWYKSLSRLDKKIDKKRGEIEKIEKELNALQKTVKETRIVASCQGNISRKEAALALIFAYERLEILSEKRQQHFTQGDNYEYVLERGYKEAMKDFGKNIRIALQEMGFVIEEWDDISYWKNVVENS